MIICILTTPHPHPHTHEHFSSDGVATIMIELRYYEQNQGRGYKTLI